MIITIPLQITVTLINFQNALIANFFTPDMYDYRNIDCDWFCLQPNRFENP